MRILVTGAGGFIGSHLTRLLVREGHSVWATVMPGKSTHRLSDIRDDVSIVPVDLREAAAVHSLVSAAKPDCAIHLAWYAVPGQYWSAAENLDCVAMTLALAQALQSVGCPRLVAAGTCAEYDWDCGVLCEHTSPLRPRTLYGICKNATREVLQSYCEANSIRLAWTRFFFVYGPGENRQRLVPSVILALLDGKTAKCTHGEQVRDLLHVEDLASAVWAVARSALTGPVNIGSGEPVKVRTVVETLARCLEAPDKIEFGSMPPGQEEPPLLLADVGKLTHQVGWRPSISLAEGLARTCEWWNSVGRRDC